MELPFKTIEWKQDHLVLLDQTLLPRKESYIKIESTEKLVEAIKMLRVRGAPAIGIAAAYGLVIGAKKIQSSNHLQFKKQLLQLASSLKSARPTAVNLVWAVNRLCHIVDTTKSTSVDELLALLEEEAKAIHQEDKNLCKKIGEIGASLFNQKKMTVLTHCNAGALATGGQGTALSIVYELKKKGIDIHVFADETRPLLQGARLTTWELQKAGVPVTLICDHSAAIVLKQHQVDCVFVGADRIAANGDVANKIGTFSVALAASTYHVPFYVAAPYSTFDLSLQSGEKIPIEERSDQEICTILDQPVTPTGIASYNPAFDITPANLITAIITDQGIIKSPFSKNIKKIEINLDKT